jgi:hypothetical protein
MNSLRTVNSIFTGEVIESSLKLFQEVWWRDEYCSGDIVYRCGVFSNRRPDRSGSGGLSLVNRTGSAATATGNLNISGGTVISSNNIVKGALGVIKPAKDREPKELWTDNRDGEQINVIACDNEHDEAAFVAEEVENLKKHGVRPGDVAVFYRTNAASRALEDVFVRTGMPYRIVGGVRTVRLRDDRHVILCANRCVT